MPLSTAAGSRLLRWDAKSDPTRVEPIITAGKATYKGHAETAFGLLEDMETRVKQVLNGLGVPVNDVINYLAFGRTVWKSVQTHHGETLAIETQIQIDKWIARGLSQSALEKIRKDVFDISAPVAP